MTMQLTKAIVHNDDLAFFCPGCGELISTKISTLEQLKWGAVCKCFTMRGYIDQCTKTNGYTFVYWDTKEE